MGKSKLERAREEREAMTDALRVAADLIANSLFEAPDSVSVSTEGVISVNWFLDDGPRIRSIIEGVGSFAAAGKAPAKWKVTRHGFFLEYDNLELNIYTDDPEVRLAPSDLLTAFSPE